MISRRTLNSLLATLPIAALSADALAKGGKTTAASPQKASPGAEAPAPLAPSVTEGATSDTPPESAAHGLEAAQERLALALIDILSKGAKASDQGNLLVSPMSLASALSAIASAGDAGFAQAMMKALQFGAASTNDTQASLQAIRDGVASVEAQSQDGPLKIARRLLLDRRIDAPPATIDGLAMRVDLARADLADPVIVGEVNQWVATKTRGLISALIDRAPGAGGLASLDAIYFKDRWKTPFDPTKTAEDMFTCADGRTAKVAMMAYSGAYRARRSDTLAAVELPFAHEQYSVVLVTTNEKPATASVLAKQASGWLESRQLTPVKGDLYVPRLDLASSSDLLNPLHALGFRDRPLIGLGAKPPRVASIAQRAVFKMNEEGAEAAAATAVIGTRAMRDDYMKSRFDKPFLFALKDRETGFVLLAGYFGQG